jgi:hypothetical protein
MIEQEQDDSHALLSRELLLSRLLEQIWHVLLAVSLIAGLFSIQRFRYTGWLPVYNLHLLIMVAYSFCWFYRRRFSFNTRVGIILLMFYLVGIGGLFSFGLIGAGIWWLILCTLIANMFYSLRTGMIHAGICLGIILVAAYTIINGYIVVPFDANNYITQPSTWLTLMVGCVALSMLIISAVVIYQRAILGLLQEVENSKKQKIKLLAKQQLALDEIKALQSIIPICSNCRKVRDDEGFWENVEAYMHRRADIHFSHGLCPDCGQMLYGGVWNEAAEDTTFKDATKPE